MASRKRLVMRCVTCRRPARELEIWDYTCRECTTIREPVETHIGIVHSYTAGSSFGDVDHLWGLMGEVLADQCEYMHDEIGGGHTAHKGLKGCFCWNVNAFIGMTDAESESLSTWLHSYAKDREFWFDVLCNIELGVDFIPDNLKEWPLYLASMRSLARKAGESHRMSQRRHHLKLRKQFAREKVRLGVS